MSSALIIFLEMSGVLGAVLVFGFWQLWSLRREKERDKARAAEAQATKQDIQEF